MTSEAKDISERKRKSAKHAAWLRTNPNINVTFAPTTNKDNVLEMENGSILKIKGSKEMEELIGMNAKNVLIPDDRD